MVKATDPMVSDCEPIHHKKFAPFWGLASDEEGRLWDVIAMVNKSQLVPGRVLVYSLHHSLPHEQGGWHLRLMQFGPFVTSTTLTTCTLS